MDFSSLDIISDKVITESFPLLPIVDKHKLMLDVFHREFPGMQNDMTVTPFCKIPLNSPFSPGQFYIWKSASGKSFLISNRISLNPLSLKYDQSTSMGGYDFGQIIYDLFHPGEKKWRRLTARRCYEITNFVYSCDK